MSNIDAYYPLNNVVAESSDDPISSGDSEIDGEGPVHAQSEVNQNRVPKILVKDVTLLELVTGQENISFTLSEREMKEVEAKAAEPDSNLIYGGTCIRVLKCIHMGRYCSRQPIDALRESVLTNWGRVYIQWPISVQKRRSFMPLNIFHKIASLVLLLQVRQNFTNADLQKEDRVYMESMWRKRREDELQEIKK